MPSSVVFAALVLAWLAVLVPVVARRRGLVPRTAEADLSAKVLSRPAAAQPVKHAAVEEDPVVGTADTADASTERGGATATVIGSAGRATALVDRDEDVEHDLDRELDLDAHDGVADHEDDVRREAAFSRERVLDRGHDGPDVGVDQYDEYGDGEYGEYDEYDDAFEPRGYRPGRGGFDPDAAQAAANARYAFRQRVALGLIAVAVLAALAALVVTSALWWLHIVADLVLVGYLVFLRRQTRIEEDVRARRAARASGERRARQARRERQAQHDDLMAAHRRDSEDWGGSSADVGDDDQGDDGQWDDAAYDELSDGSYDDVSPSTHDQPASRWAAPRTPAPAVPDGMELVADSDDDPAFHTLDGRDAMPAYRRAAAAGA